MISDDSMSGDLFDCQRCGDCCKGYGGTYLTEVEIDIICRYLGMNRERFFQEACQMSGDKALIAQAQNGYCVFWDQLCRIHPVKPQMCRRWPFIDSLLVDIRNWPAMAASCPGMRIDASEDQIRKYVQKVLNKGTAAL